MKRLVNIDNARKYVKRGIIADTVYIGIIVTITGLFTLTGLVASMLGINVLVIPMFITLGLCVIGCVALTKDLEQLSVIEHDLEAEEDSES